MSTRSLKIVVQIAAREFALMKPMACLVNVGRGPRINEQMLYDARLLFHDLVSIIMTPHKLTAETMASPFP